MSEKVEEKVTDSAALVTAAFSVRERGSSGRGCSNSSVRCADRWSSRTASPDRPTIILPNEQQPGPNNTVNDSLNPDSVWPPETDNGTMLPFKYSFDLSHKEIDSGDGLAR